MRVRETKKGPKCGIASENNSGNTIELRNVRYRGEPARLMLVDGAVESAAYRTEGLRNELIFPYLKQLSQAFFFRPDIRETLLIGGGGFAYPKYYISRYRQRRMDVIEIMPQVIEAARKFFYLDEFIEKEGLNPKEVFVNLPASEEEAAGGFERASCRVYPEMPVINGKEETESRLRIFCEDGMNYLLRSDRRYDLIINDAFTGKAASGDLASEDGIRLVKAHLNRNGLYMVNVTTAGRGVFAGNGRALKERVGRHFRVTALIPCDEELSEYERQNYLLAASDFEL